MNNIFLIGIILLSGIGAQSAHSEMTQRDVQGVGDENATQVIQVGPNRVYKTPSAAAMVATDGALIEIDAAVYPGDVAVWPQSGLTLRGVGGRPHLKAEGNSAEEKAIWVIKGNDVTVENVELSGARVADMNGAGIRHEGGNLTIRNTHFHDNEMGILTGNSPESEILIEGSEFNENTVDYQRYGLLGHNIYIGGARRFTLRASYIHHAMTGHNVKSRAKENYILYNRIMDETGGSSYLVDLSGGGEGYLIGNLFHQGKRNENSTLIAFAAEGDRTNPDQVLYVVNNSFVNDDSGGMFVQNFSIASAQLKNNLFIGRGSALAGPGQLTNNLMKDEAGLRDQGAYDYRLTAGSAAIDQGIDPGQAENGFSLLPEYQYVHPLSVAPRPVRGRIDIGAYEYNEDNSGGGVVE